MVKNMLADKMESKVIIIAEAGVNHNGMLSIAKKLVDAAKSSGADYIKFQTFSTDRLVTKDAELAEYQKQNSNYKSQYEILKKLELHEQDLINIVSYCKAKDIGFLSTGFDIQSVSELNNFGMDYFKIPSGEIDNLPYLRFVGGLGKSLILSTGMTTNDEIARAIDVLGEAGTFRSQITVLHCTSEYPAPFEDVNLKAILSIKAQHKVNVGYSDHTQGIEVAIAAAAMGAKMIEKHITINRGMEGPDHKASLEPDELTVMVSSIRNIEKALGDGEKKVMPSEFKNRTVVRKSIVAVCDILKGEMFTEENINIKRPGSGLSPMMWDDVVGRRAARNFKRDEMIQL